MILWLGLLVACIGAGQMGYSAATHRSGAADDLGLLGLLLLAIGITIVALS